MGEKAAEAWPGAACQSEQAEEGRRGAQHGAGRGNTTWRSSQLVLQLQGGGGRGAAGGKGLVCHLGLMGAFVLILATSETASLCQAY